MKPLLVLLLLFGNLALSAAVVTLFCEDASSSEELIASYPDLEADSNRKGNANIVCPFLRLLERSGALDDVAPGYIVSVEDLLETTYEFGCPCEFATNAVSAGQTHPQQESCLLTYLRIPGNLLGIGGWKNPPQIWLERLWDAGPFSHDCGLTYVDKRFDQDRYNATMARLASKANAEGQLVLQDLQDVKLETCAEEGVMVTSEGEQEMRNIWGYLGGVDRGYIDYADVEIFLKVDSEMPSTKASKQLSLLYGVFQ